MPSIRESWLISPKTKFLLIRSHPLPLSKTASLLTFVLTWTISIRHGELYAKSFSEHRKCIWVVQLNMRSFHTPLTVIENLSRNRGDLPAVRYADPGLINNGYKTISYAEYWNDIENTAEIWLSILSKAGVTKGSVVGLW